MSVQRECSFFADNPGATHWLGAASNIPLSQQSREVRLLIDAVKVIKCLHDQCLHEVEGVPCETKWTYSRIAASGNGEQLVRTFVFYGDAPLIQKLHQLFPKYTTIGRDKTSLGFDCECF